MREEQIVRLFGVREETVRERLDDVLTEDAQSAILSYAQQEAVFRFSAEDSELYEAVKGRLGAYIYSETDETLEQRVVALLNQKAQTVAVAESCTGGMLASRLTAVSGCSQVFGTGVVSYSWECKKQLLGVSLQTLETYGAVSAQTAREMADGIRRRSGAAIGIGITGEAGPTAAEDKPVGTVFVSLADKKRCWVRVLHLDGDRDSVRRVATSYALDMVRRYLEAFPTVMAGGERHSAYAEKRRQEAVVQKKQHRLISALLPWRGSIKRRLVKILAWLSVLVLLTVGIVVLYNRVLAPASNRELQDELAAIYWNGSSDLTAEPVEGDYPSGMKAQFRGLYDINTDVAGWIRVPETSVNYPVMQYANGYYANHNFNDQYSIYGQPYFDDLTTTEALQTNRLLMICGNNTRDEQMFSDIVSYRRIAYLQEHAVVEMSTLYEDALWEIFAVVLVDERDRAEVFDYHPRVFESNAAFAAYIHNLEQRSMFTANVTVTAQDQILLLVTDVQKEYHFSGARLVVAARRVEAPTEGLTYTHNAAVEWPQAYERYTTTRRPFVTSATTTTTASLTTSALSTTQPSTSVNELTTVTSSTDTTVSTVTVDDATTTVSSTEESTTPTTQESTTTGSTTEETGGSTTITSSKKTDTSSSGDADEENTDDDNLGN